jgi:hypothetical protein
MAAMSDVSADRLPDYDELLRRTDAPAGSSWRLWGTDDQLGALNLLTNERTAAAARLVRTGQVFPLGLPLEEPPRLAWRAKPVHEILRVGHEARGSKPGGVDDTSGTFIDRDDMVDGLWLQGSTQRTRSRVPRTGYRPCGHDVVVAVRASWGVQVRTTRYSAGCGR